MYAITGITGQVGGAVAETLLAQGLEVRAIVRNPQKAETWKARGCEIAPADIADVNALADAFRHVDAVFVLLPPVFDPSPGFTEGKVMLTALHAALNIARPPRIVCLSTIGAQAVQPNLLNLLGMLETTLGELPSPVTFLRAAWFMENALWDVPAARDEGVLRSFLQPLDKAFPMIATRDVGALAAALLQETWTGKRVVELEGPQRITPVQLAAAFANALGHRVKAEAVPRDAWIELFTRRGMQNPTPRMQMIDGFNQGWICFESDDAHIRKGSTPLDAVINELIDRR